MILLIYGKCIPSYGSSLRLEIGNYLEVLPRLELGLLDSESRVIVITP